jgi:hypothetical protein
MAKNTGNGYRRGEVCDRSQLLNPKTQNWIERNSESGQFTRGKDGPRPFKGVRKEK